MDKIEALILKVKQSLADKKVDTVEYINELNSVKGNITKKKFEFDYDLYRQRLNEELEMVREFDQQTEQNEEDERTDSGGDSDDGRVIPYPQQYGTEIRGSEINGSEDDKIGFTVSLNASGNTIAIGAPFATAGYVMVFEWNGSDWTQKGSDITDSGLFGYDVELDATGDFLVVGAPQYDEGDGAVFAYEFTGSSWSLFDAPVFGTLSENLGYSVSVSRDATTVAAGAILSNQVFAWDVSDGGFETKGTINHGFGASWMGYDVKLSYDGDTIVFGGPTYLAGKGISLVFEYSEDWTQKGSSLAGILADEAFGTAVDISNDGNTIVTSAVAGGDGTQGVTRIFIFSNDDWVQLGSSIVGESMMDSSGHSVSINGTGNIVAISSIYNDSSSGHVRIFKYDVDNWYQLARDIDGTPNSWFGYSTSLNDKGDFLAVGSIFADSELGVDSGSVKVYGILGV
jgi:hypothetical protein